MGGGFTTGRPAHGAAGHMGRPSPCLRRNGCPTWRDGNREAAIALEQLWSELAQRHRFAILCAYPLSQFCESDSNGFDGVCTCHSHVLPAESYSTLTNDDERLRAISALRQRAQSLAAEIEHRREIEQFLRQRERELSEALEQDNRGSELTTVRRLLELCDKPIHSRRESSRPSH